MTQITLMPPALQRSIIFRVTSRLWFTYSWKNCVCSHGWAEAEARREYCIDTI